MSYKQVEKSQLENGIQEKRAWFCIYNTTVQCFYYHDHPIKHW